MVWVTPGAQGAIIVNEILTNSSFVLFFYFLYVFVLGLLYLKAVTIDKLRNFSALGPIHMSPRFSSVTLTNFARAELPYEKVGVLIGKFEFNPQRRPICAWFKPYFTAEKIPLNTE